MNGGNMDKSKPHLKHNFRTFRMAYMVASESSWNVHYELDLFSVKMLSELCMALSRSFLIEHVETGIRFQAISPYLLEHMPEDLNLFFNSLSGRCAESTDK
jgi:hypothetical protein